MRIFQVIPFMKLQKQSYSAILLENSALLDLFVVFLLFLFLLFVSDIALSW